MASMAVPSKKVKDLKKHVLRNAEDIVSDKVSDNTVEEMTKIGIVWSGILHLDSAIQPAEVAAMIAASELVKATHYVDSEAHWTNAAAYSALGAYSEPELVGAEDAVSNVEDEENITPIGFTPGHTKTIN